VKLPDLPFTPVHWTALPATHHPGETEAAATWRTLNNGDVRMRVVEYAPGYLADHWCDRGHVIYVLEGELKTELKDGRIFTFGPGEGYTVSDFGDAAHRSSTETGAKLFIVD
jgi:quercetin dioxygenase-like cupin family protein